MFRLLMWLPRLRLNARIDGEIKDKSVLHFFDGLKIAAIHSAVSLPDYQCSSRASMSKLPGGRSRNMTVTPVLSRYPGRLMTIALDAFSGRI